MEYTQKLPRPGAARLWIGVGLMLLTTVAGALLSHARPLTESVVTIVTMMTALGVLAMALVMAPVTAYPRWAHWASALVLAGWALASPLLAGDPEGWRTQAEPQLWLMPWFLLTAATTRRRAAGVCATEGRRAGWILVASTAVVGGVLMLAGWIGRAL